MPRNGAACILATRRGKIRQADCHRVIVRPFIPGGEERVRSIIKRVMTLSEDEVTSLLNQVMEEFAYRHRRFIESLQRNYELIAGYVPEDAKVSESRRLLLGAYFTNEYSIQSAGVLNPSIVPHPDQENLPVDHARYLITFRCVGEGHISSLEFRSCVLDDKYRIMTRPLSCHIETPEWIPTETYNRALFEAQLKSRGMAGKFLRVIVDRLPEDFTLKQLDKVIEEAEVQRTFPKRFQSAIREVLGWLSKNVYTVQFRSDTRISGRVLFPAAENECRGIEDARFVRFTDDDGTVTYYGTYTGYNGFTIASKILETDDFLKFKSTTLVGRAARNKGLALFPRRINGRYAALARMDNESNYIAYTDNIYCWEEAQLIRGPLSPWEFVQIGNGGSPIETEAGWLVLTHGVGPMRKYCLGVDLLDLNDPSRLIGRTQEPILAPNEYEREGYVPNVVYTCGAVIHRDELIITYAMSDWESGLASIPVKDLINRCLL
ncbi:glycoside hydrolase family 130 protein [Desulforudis sp. 1088]|uniref:glycoside hydrolase family 130 protein n=1 Tax=unclassified Candidatus Desulforudis TaxID=2635950 RepID=UPI003CE4E463